MILGDSGSGKTLIDIICGLTNPDEGNIKNRYTYFRKYI